MLVLDDERDKAAKGNKYTTLMPLPTCLYEREQIYYLPSSIFIGRGVWGVHIIAILWTLIYRGVSTKKER